ncbi:hypothetical protein A9Q81_06780 [Gammaproteobacteria bacterium 42_54_T18]|nr:hypothetical protein A9Q81_06780 [Gammaproteobacteria bacterium 42_54_T18]
MTDSLPDPDSKDSAIVSMFNSLVELVSPEKKKVIDEDASLLDQSLSLAKEFFERQAAGGISLITSSDCADDVVALKNKSVCLKLNLGRLQALAGSKVHFIIDGTDVGSGSTQDSGEALMDYMAADAGCFHMDFSIESKIGIQVSDVRSNEDVLLHVLDRKPVVCVDARLITEQSAACDQQLFTMAEKGFDILYVDFGKKDRTDDIRQIRKERSLPLGAIVPLTARIRQFETFDVDFQQTFLSLTVNRLRAKGAPVVGFITESELDQQNVFPNVRIISPNETMDAESLQQLETNTRNFLLERDLFRKDSKNDIEWRLDQLVKGRWIPNNKCHVELDNKRARTSLFKAIDEANIRVDLQFYIFKESRFTHELGMHLAKAANRGVQVRLMVDALYSRENFLGSWNSFLRQIKKVNRIHILAADPLPLSSEWDTLSLRQRDHRKIAIIDNTIAFVGGRNAADEYYYSWSEVPISDWTTSDYIPWLDAHVELRGAAVQTVQTLFNDTWKRNRGADFPPIQRDRDQAKEKSIGSRVRLVVHDGISDANGLAAYEALIGGAKKTLFLVNDFPVIDDIAELLIHAVKRGVSVTFITGSVQARRADGSFFKGGIHRELFEYVTKSRLGMLSQAGVKVVEFQTKVLENIATVEGKVRPYVHAKLVTADGRYASIGSANLDISASYWEREANIVIEDPSVVSALDLQLCDFVKDGVVLDTNSLEWRREAPQREVVSKLWPDTFLN